jgi:hypothetical protein
VASTPFRIKLAMIVVAAVAAASNQKRQQAEAISWDRAGQASLAARGTAVVSLAAIVSAIVAGRLIAYF